MAQTLQITGNATNEDGVSTPFTGSIIVEAPVPTVQSVVVTPQSAQAGTLRTITISAAGAVSYTCQVNGQNATATAQPHVFTFIA